MGGIDAPAQQGTEYMRRFDTGSQRDNFVLGLEDWVVAHGEMTQRARFALARTPQVLVGDVTHYVAYIAVGVRHRYLARFDDAKPSVLGSVRVHPASRGWQQIALRATGAQLEASLGSTQRVAAHDETFARGRVGLCTTNGTSAHFDDLEVHPLPIPTTL